MRNVRRGRLSLRDQRIAVNKALNHYAVLSGRPTPPVLLNEITPPPIRRASKPGRVLEKDVLASVLAALRADKRVALCERQQSGVFVEGNRHIRVGTRGALDVRGYLVGGAAFEIEVKRPGGRLTPEQIVRIDALRANGVIAGVATSAAEALALLP